VSRYDQQYETTCEQMDQALSARPPRVLEAAALGCILARTAWLEYFVEWSNAGNRVPSPTPSADSLLDRIRASRGVDTSPVSTMLRYSALAVAVAELDKRYSDDAYHWFAHDGDDHATAEGDPIELIIHTCRDGLVSVYVRPGATAEEILALAFEASRDYDIWRHIFLIQYTRVSHIGGLTCAQRALASLRSAHQYPDGIATLNGLVRSWAGTINALDDAVACLCTDGVVADRTVAVGAAAVGTATEETTHAVV